MKKYKGKVTGVEKKPYGYILVIDNDLFSVNLPEEDAQDDPPEVGDTIIITRRGEKRIYQLSKQ